MKLVKVNSGELGCPQTIWCVRELNAEVCDIDSEFLIAIPEDGAVVEKRWCRTIRTFEYKGDLYISKLAFDYWEMQSRISDWLMSLGLDDADYDEKYIEFRGSVLDCYSPRELENIFYDSKGLVKVRRALGCKERKES